MKAYKYRGGSPNILMRDLESIVDNYFWSPTVDQLNDPSEAYVNDTEMLRLIRALKADGVEAAFQTVTKMRHSVGVYSLSKTPFDELMWAYYAASHEGFCIEYDLDRLTLEAKTEWSIIDVLYHSMPQTIVLEDLLGSRDETTILNKIIGTKSSRWEHEKEIRVITTKPGKQYYAPMAIKRIYFGCRCSDEFISKFRQKLSGRGLAYSKIAFSTDSYQINHHELEYDIVLDGARPKYLAPIEKGAIPSIELINEQNAPLYEYLNKAAKLVQSDTSCEKIISVEFSTSRIHNGKSDVYVQYETNVPTLGYNALNKYFTIDELDDS